MINFSDKIVKRRLIVGGVLTSILALCIAMTCYDPLAPIMALDDEVRAHACMSPTPNRPWPLRSAVPHITHTHPES